MEWNQNNISTVAGFIVILISPIISALGYEVDKSYLLSYVMAIIGLATLVWSARNPNTIKVFGNSSENVEVVEDGGA